MRDWLDARVLRYCNLIAGKLYIVLASLKLEKVRQLLRLKEIKFRNTDTFRTRKNFTSISFRFYSI